MTAFPDEAVDGPAHAVPSAAPEPVVALSIIVPVKDEAASIRELQLAVHRVMEATGERSFEILFVDDGSTDGSWDLMRQLATERPETTRAIRLRRNFGKSAALMVGFRHARGGVVVTMDADLQDDPDEIPRLLARLEEGYDLVSGWKETRQDPLSKTLPSKLFNRVTGLLTGVPLHDFNCGFKAYRRDVLKNLRLYGELHRYIPVLAHDLGFRITEVSVRHHPRRHGTSKFGAERFARGLLDLFTILATTRYLQRPGHLFGGLGLALGSAGTLALTYLGTLWMLGHRPIGNRPLLFVAILLVIVAVQLVSLGILAELIVRNSDPRTAEEMVADVTKT